MNFVQNLGMVRSGLKTLKIVPKTPWLINVVIFNMTEKCRFDIGNIFFFFIREVVEEGGGIFQGMNELYLRDIELLGCFYEDIPGNAFISKFFRNLFCNLFSLA